MTFKFLPSATPRGKNTGAFCSLVPAVVGAKVGIRANISPAMQKKYSFRLGDRVLLGHDAGDNSFALVKHSKGYKLGRMRASKYLSCRMPIIPSSPFEVPKERLDYEEAQVEKVDGMYVLKPAPILPEAGSYSGCQILTDPNCGCAFCKRDEAEDAHLPA